MSAKNEIQTPAKRGAATSKKAAGFTDVEKAAMKERAGELKAARGAKDKAGEEAAVLAKIAELPEPDRGMATRLHAIIKASAPALSPKLWYGMPAYYLEGKVVCHFQAAQKFGTRYSSLGFSDAAKLDDGDMWPVAFALRALTDAGEKRIGALVKQAAG